MSNEDPTELDKEIEALLLQQSNIQEAIKKYSNKKGDKQDGNIPFTLGKAPADAPLADAPLPSNPGNTIHRLSGNQSIPDIPN